MVCLLGRWDSIEIYCSSLVALPPGFWGLWGKAISKGVFKCLQVLLRRSFFIYGLGWGMIPPFDPCRRGRFFPGNFISGSGCSGDSSGLCSVCVIVLTSLLSTVGQPLLSLWVR